MTTQTKTTAPTNGQIKGVPKTGEAILEIKSLRKWFPIGGGLLGIGKKGMLKAVDDISFNVEKARTFGLVGESGCGKTTTAKVLLGLDKPTAGELVFEGEDTAKLTKAGRKRFRSSIQAVFQDPWSSLNPRMRVTSIIAEPLEIATTMTKAQVKSRVGELLAEVGLNPYQGNLYPHEFSGGQRQRIGIARALALNPKVVVLDEPVSALDVSIRAQIMNLLVDLQDQHGLAYLLIAHNLATVRYMCHQVGVMYLGKIREIGPTEDVFTDPLHPYTKALISAALPSHPDIKREEIILTGEVPSPVNPPSGCNFNPRCYVKIGEVCEKQMPELQEQHQPQHYVSCHLYDASSAPGKWKGQSQGVAAGGTTAMNVKSR